MYVTCTTGLLPSNADWTDAPPDVDLCEALVPAEWASGNGYAQSKWVGESILARASTESSTFRPTIIRTGQLSGGPNGAWNKQEWVPAMVQSAVKIGMLPVDDDEKVRLRRGYSQCSVLIPVLYRVSRGFRFISLRMLSSVSQPTTKHPRLATPGSSTSSTQNPFGGAPLLKLSFVSSR